MYKTFIEMFAALLTVGGTGTINYIIAEKLNAIDKSQESTNREKALALIFSMFNLFIYVCMNIVLINFFSGNSLIIVTMLSTIVISLGLTFLGARKVNHWFYSILNLIRRQDGLSNRSSKTTWQSTFELHGHKNQLVFLYNFDHKPLGFGWRLGVSNDRDTNYAISLEPQFDESEPEGQPSYEKISKLIQEDNFQNDFEVKQFVSFKQQFIAIIATYKES